MNEDREQDHRLAMVTDGGQGLFDPSDLKVRQFALIQ